MIEGIVIRAYGGYYYVFDGRQEWECLLRGRFRYENRQVLVGDRVYLKPRHGRAGVIEEVLPRRTVLVRPPVANVDQAVIVFAVKDPDPSPRLLDRFLVVVHMNKIEPLICFNKVDLAESGRIELISRYRERYRVVATSARSGEGLSLLRESLRGRVSVFAGPSGVGKSTILNAILPGLNLKTGEISAKLKRGRHTTRHVELVALPEGGLVADTPGFSSLDLPDLKPEELAGCFPEIEAYQEGCYFAGCLHYREPRCAVKEAVGKGLIEESRYRQYVEFVEELMDRRRY
ncbi:MAG: ribosome small subunit-dependent GTPase A [Pelotomaculum sp.]|nr:ribosome small subunit-dependent GTPase A [Pelotomaculum sp.]